MTDIDHMSSAEVAELSEHYMREARKMRAREMARIFGGLFSRIYSVVAGIFSRPQTLAGSAR